MQSGYQLTFLTRRDHCFAGQPLGEWLVAEAQRLGIGGATLLAAEEGYGHRGKLHSVHFFELADQPVEVMMAVTRQDAERLFERLAQEKIQVFCIKTPIEFGLLDGS